MICEHCEMYVPERMVDGSLPPEHVCPKPYPLDVARMIARAARYYPVHPRVKARCVLAYKSAGLIPGS